jgi:hypothetical protein
MMVKRKLQRVFILGAGVSASCGIPVAQNILRAAMDRLESHDGPVRDRIHKLLDYLYPSFSIALRNYPNIEDFMNLVEMAQQVNSKDFIESSMWPAKDLAKVAASVLQAVTDFLWGQMKDCNLDPLKKFAKYVLAEGDTVVTFNWDVTLEKVLDEDDDLLNFWYEPTAEILLLKPHGSIDWFRRAKLPKDIASSALRKIDDELSVYPEFTLAKHKAMKSQTPVIVPPVAIKDFRSPFFQKTWTRVYRVVSQATEVYFIGYSLPKEDQFARLVLSRALLNNRLKAKRAKKPELTIRVVNPDEGAQQTFIGLVGQGFKTHFEFFHTTFDRFVESVAEELITL